MRRRAARRRPRNDHFSRASAEPFTASSSSGTPEPIIHTDPRNSGREMSS